MELFCILCGRRWMINKDTSAFGRWLEKKDNEHAKDYSTSS